MTRVLIVDDHLSFGQELTQLLELGGFDVVGLAGSIAEAEQILQVLPADLALVDVVLPGINGIEGMPRLRAITPDLPIILMSAHRDQADLFQTAAHQAGKATFIVKDDLDLGRVRSLARFIGVFSSLKGEES
ncbi:MAG: response regulator [Chloroflexi bacterium]|nr:response regulator [Chloroflexota bacterium]